MNSPSRTNRPLSFDEALEAMENGWIVSRKEKDDLEKSYFAILNNSYVYIDPYSSGYPSTFETSLTTQDLEAIWFLTNIKTLDFLGSRWIASKRN